MNFLLVLLALVAVGAIVMYTSANAAKAKLLEASRTSREELDGVRTELQQVKNDTAEARKSAADREKELAKLRDEVKNAKKRAHEHKSQAEDTAKELTTLQARMSAFEGMDEAREQMMAAQTSAANLEAELQTLRARLGEAEAPSADEGDDTSDMVDRAVIRELEARHRAELR